MRHAKGCSRSHPWLLGSFRVPSCRRRRHSHERQEIKVAYPNESHGGFGNPPFLDGLTTRKPQNEKPGRDPRRKTGEDLSSKRPDERESEQTAYNGLK